MRRYRIYMSQMPGQKSVHPSAPSDNAEVLPRVRLLIADDDIVLQTTLRDLLELVTPSEIVGQVSTVQALYPAMLEQAPDIVLLDRSLPGEWENARLERLYEINPRVRIIVLCTETDELVPEFAPPPAAFVNKSEPSPQLLKVLGEQIAHVLAEKTRCADSAQVKFERT